MRYAVILLLAITPAASPRIVRAQEPPAINPFGPRPTMRDDAVRGCIELSDGAIKPGMIYLTRDLRLEIFDRQVQRRREVPLQAVARIECLPVREWMEKEWRFKENASDVKVFTGRAYPAREYEHTITLHDRRTITGRVNAIVYLQAENGGPAERFILHERDKGPIGTDLKSLVYVRSVQLGDQSYYEAQRRAKLLPQR